MTGLSNVVLAPKAALRLSRVTFVLVASGVAILGATLAGVGFGFVFNYTHSAPFGLYRGIADPASVSHTPAPYVFFCPDRRWPTMVGQPNYREPSHSCPDGLSPLIKPVLAWPGDTVRISSIGFEVNGRFIKNTAAINHDSSGHIIRPYPAGTYTVQKDQLWVVSNFSPRSFDSRYFGPIPLRSVHNWVKPFIVEKTYHPSEDRK